MWSRGRPFRRAGIVVVVAAYMFVVANAPPVPVAAAETTISFEESIPSPGNVTSQYCNNAATNKGVLFLEPVRLIEPGVGTNSPTHAATNRFIGDEFTEPRIMRVSFTADQALVSVRVGLDRDYKVALTASLRVYTSPSPSPATEITGERASVVLGPTATAITHELFATSPSTLLRIRSLEIEFTGLAPGTAGHEVVDDLAYSTVGPPCVADGADPIVEIIEPAAGAPFYGSPSGGDVPVSIHLRAADTGTGVASLGLDFLDAGSNRLDGFSVCGGANAPACPLPSTTVERQFWSFMPPATAALRVTAEDFAGNDASSVRPLTITTSTANVWARGLEITQAVQPWLAENAASRRATAASPVTFAYPAAPTAVPLVAGRTTVARLFVGAEGTIGGGPLPGVGGELRCYTESSYTVPCPGPSVIYPEERPPNTTAVVTVDPGENIVDQRRGSAKTLNFVLPEAWTKAGAISLEASVSSPVPECAGCTDAANRIRVHTISFRTVPAWDRMVRQLLVERPAQGTATMTERWEVLDFIRRVYPIDELTVVDGWQRLVFPGLGISGPVPSCSSALADLRFLLDAEFEDLGYRSVWGLTDSQTPEWCSGLGSADGVAVSRGNRWDSGAHEVGHTFGLLHSGNPGFENECQDPEWCDSDWPWPQGGTGTFGLDVFRFEVHDPGPVDAPVEHDIMSYGPSPWISSRTWIRLFNSMAGWSMPYPKATSTSASGASIASIASEEALETASATPTPHLLVRGRYDSATGAWQLLPIYEVMRSPNEPTPESPDLTVALTDGVGGVLATQPIDLADGEHVDVGDPGDVAVPDPSFVRFIEMAPGTEEVVLLQGSTVLASRSRSDSRPEVSIGEPTTASGFDGDVRWTWSDDDGDDLRAIVEYRHAPDAPWQTLALDYVDDAFGIDPTLLPGGSAAQVRVTVTDGLNTATSLSEPFPVPDSPPVVEIIRPFDDDRFEAGRRIVLQGVAADREDEALTSAAFEWSSDLDGPLGTGGELELLAGLSPGTHVITLTATDSGTNTATASVVIEVHEPAVLNHQPVADAGPDRGWSPSGIVLDGTGSSDADGDTLAFHWSIVSAPAGAVVWFDDPDSAAPTVHASASGTYEFALVVHDGTVGSLPDRVVVRRDSIAPTTTVSLDPATPNGLNGWYVSPVTITLTGADDAGGSGLERIEHRIDSGGWSIYSVPLIIAADGLRVFEARSIDRAGNVEAPTASMTIRLDRTAPTPVVTTPTAGSRIVGPLMLTATSTDATSGTTSLWFTVREDDGGGGRPIGLEHLDAQRGGTGWTRALDTVPLPDGSYLVTASAEDEAGNRGSSTPTRFGVHNWVVTALLPPTPENRAGRTVPVKFTITMAAAADPSMASVRRTDLAVVIYETAKPGVVLQRATFGVRSRDYRIDDIGRFYITNFRSLRRPTEYTVEVTRAGLVIGSFTFVTH